MDLDTETYPVDITNIDCDRDIRTYQGNQEIEIPMITLFKEGPKTDVINNGRINGGKAKKPSVIRITTLSTFLFDTADIIPIGTPIIIDKKTTPRATLIDDMLA